MLERCDIALVDIVRLGSIKKLALEKQDKLVTPYETISAIIGIVTIALLGIEVGRKK